MAAFKLKLLYIHLKTMKKYSFKMRDTAKKESIKVALSDQYDKIDMISKDKQEINEIYIFRK